LCVTKKSSRSARRHVYGSRDVEVEVVKAAVVSFSRKAKEKYKARKAKGKKEG